MNKKKTIIFFLILAVLFNLPLFTEASNESPSTIPELDKLSKTDNIITLDGKWEFYWNQLLEPEAFKNSNLKPDRICRYTWCLEWLYHTGTAVAWLWICHLSFGTSDG